MTKMHVFSKALIFTLFLTNTHQNNDSHRAGRRLLDFRKMMKVFVSISLSYTVPTYNFLVNKILDLIVR